jgi:hypothetical protein
MCRFPLFSLALFTNEKLTSNNFATLTLFKYSDKMGRLNADLITNSLSYLNCLKERELLLRGMYWKEQYYTS